MACENGVCDINLPQTCAEASCYHNMDGFCMLEGYKGPTMKEGCEHYEED